VVFFSAFLAAGLAGAGVDVVDDELVLELDDELDVFLDPEASALESVR
jgi:hypothetical protein